MSSKFIRRAVQYALWTGAATVAVAQTVHAQDSNIQEVVVTGTRITVPNAVSSSPILSVGVEEIQMQQATQIESVLRTLPVTALGDNAASNNGSAGAATVNLRGLGPQRNLILINGKRVTPFNFDGMVDTAVIPPALIERVDIITGGASAVYGSDAIAGAINFVMKRDFEGVDIGADFSQYEEGDGNNRNAYFVMGTNVADGRGNIVFGLNWTDREGVQLGQRPSGRLGITTANGAGYANYVNGIPPTAPEAGCGGPNSVAVGGSPTTLPTRVEVGGGAEIGQFRDDGTLGDNCGVFNFNPYNYYETPLERFGGMVLGRFEMNEHAEAYGRFSYTNTKVRTQVAPSGIFGSAFWTPVMNPFLTDQARSRILGAFNAGVADGTVATAGDFPNWRDLNNNGVVDADDDVRIGFLRRTVEFGERSTTYENNSFQMQLGVRGKLIADWDYDVFGQYGESNRSNLSAGYTNLPNAEAAVDAIMGPNGTPVCRNGDPACVPLNLFGGFGAITPEMAAFSAASAIEQQYYQQKIVGASVSGPIQGAQLPWAANPLAMSIGAEYREETGTVTPDECWKQQPVPCLGGAGGSILPIAGGFDVREIFAEALLPLANDLPAAQSLDLELGFRYSDYTPSGANRTYKYGLSWKPLDQVLVRAMKQRAVRAPNVGELASPQTTALDNALLDPCSNGNANISPELRALCISTGMSNAQVGAVPNVRVQQVNTFQGTDLENLPRPETADTLTLGVVWSPDFIPGIRDTMISLDYYDIEINDIIGEFGAQEILDACYQFGLVDQCSKIRRVGGGLTLDGSGIETYTTNLRYLRAEGIELGFGFGFDIGALGNIRLSGNVNKYLTHESQSDSTTAVIDCVGVFGTNCGNGAQGGPLPEVRALQRTTWSFNDFQLSLLWRYTGGMSSATPIFPAFQEISSYSHFDMFGSWNFLDNATVTLGVTNLFDKDPPIVGNEAADTRSNSGNTFPALYDTLGRRFQVGLRMNF
jgi:iron complex outermembrane receptor protein